MRLSAWSVFVLSLIVIVGTATLFRWLLLAHGLRVTSWLRTPWKNQEVGGTAKSLHLIGWAADVIPVNVALQRLRKWLPFAKFVVEGDHVHIQLF